MSRILIHISINIRKVLVDALKQHLKDFNKKYGMNTTIETVDSNQEGTWLVNCLNQDSFPDMALAHASDFVQLERKKLKEKLLPLPGRFPLQVELEKEGLRDPEGILHPVFLVPFVIVCNARMLSQDERPSKWEDLLEPKWHHKVTFPAAGTPISQAVTAFLKAHYSEKFREFYSSLEFQKSPVEVIKSVGDGVFPLGIANLGFAKMLQQKNVVPVWPEEGVVCNPLVLVYSRQADERLLELGDLLFAEQIQRMLVPQGFIPINKEVAQSDQIARQVLHFPWDGWDKYFDDLRKGSTGL